MTMQKETRNWGGQRNPTEYSRILKPSKIAIDDSKVYKTY